MNEANLWDTVMIAVEKRVNHECFTTWFKPITFVGCDQQTIRLRVPDGVFEDWILNNYREVLEESLEEVNYSGRNISFEVSARADIQESNSGPYPNFSGTKDRAEVRKAGPQQPVYSESGGTETHFSDNEPADLPLNLKYTFDTFVVGSCNQFAHAASLAVADTPSKTYNPLYIYGGVGLGKTHLMCAIGHRVKEQNRHLRLCYISAEKFMN